MKPGAKITFWISASLIAATAVQAVTDDSNPYARIVERNVFSLKDPPPPPPPPPPPIPKITLQGITSILGSKQVLFKCQPQGGKEQSYILNEGEGQDDVEVLAIDEEAGSIKFNNHGTIQTLTMDKDASKPPAAAAPAVAGVPRPIPTAAVPGRMAVPPPSPSSGGSSVTSFGAGQPGLRQIPTRSVRTGGEAASGGMTVAAPPSHVPQFTAEEQEALIELNKLKAKDEGDPTAAIFPPTSMSAEIEAEESGSALVPKQ